MTTYIRLDPYVADEMILGDHGAIDYTYPSMMGGYEGTCELSDGRWFTWNPFTGDPVLSTPTNWIPLTEPMVHVQNVKYLLLLIQNDVEDETGIDTFLPVARASIPNYYDLMVHPMTVL